MTGSFGNWDGDLTQLGPIYPFPGWEGLMALILLVVWIVWHVLQVRAESRQLEDEARHLRQADNLRKAVETERVIERF